MNAMINDPADLTLLASGVNNEAEKLDRIKLTNSNI